MVPETGVNWVESPPKSYHMGSPCLIFLFTPSAIVKLWKSGTPIGYPLFPPMFSFLLRPLLYRGLLRLFPFPNLNRHLWQKSGPITARSENAQNCFAVGFARPQTVSKLAGARREIPVRAYLDCYHNVFIHCWVGRWDASVSSFRYFENLIVSNTSRSRKWNASLVSREFGIVSSRSWGLNVSVSRVWEHGTSRSCDLGLTSCGHVRALKSKRCSQLSKCWFHEA